MTVMGCSNLFPFTTASLLDLFQQTKTYQIIDCRSYIAHHRSHIKKAINVCCPTILRRRLRKSGSSLEALISCETTLNSLREVNVIVLYDDNSALPPTRNDTLSFIGSILAVNLKKKIYYLLGGFQLFQAEHPNMCEWNHLPCGDLPSRNSAASSLYLDFNKKSSRESSCDAEDRSPPVEILPFLYLGNELHCSSKDVLENLGVTAVMNVSKTINNHFQGSFVYKNIPVEDNHNADISRWFHAAVEFIDSVETSGGKVLIHCQAGVSRSATICLAYLMSKKGYSLEEAYKYVKARRPVISPNFHFMGQLLNWEREISCFKSSKSPEKLSPSTSSQCCLFSYSAIKATPDSRTKSLHQNNCFVTVSTPT